MSAPASDRSRLTAVIVVDDAEADYLSTSDSVAPAADEIILLNMTGERLAGGSARRVPEVVACPADDPSSARNEALGRARGEWILFLEAGETLRIESAAAIREWLSDNPAPETALLCWLESPASAPDASGEQLAAVRMLPKRAGLRFTGRVRETVLPSIEALELPMEIRDWRIDAPSPTNDALRAVRNAKRQLRLASLDAQQFGTSPRGLTASAEAHAALGDRDRAMQHYYQSLRLADRGSLEMLIAYYGLLGLFRGDESDRRQQLAVCLEALETFPFDAQLLCAMGAYLQQQDHLELACRSFQAAFEIGQVEPRAPHLRDLPALGALSWSLILQLRGDHDRAWQVLEQAWQRFPHARSLARRRLELLVQLGRDHEALHAAASAAEPGTALEPLRIGIRGACLAAQGNWIPALGYLRTAHESGCRDPICLRWLTVGLLALGQADAARPILMAWREASPSDVEARRYEQELAKLASSVATQRKPKGRTTRVDASSSPVEAPLNMSAMPVGQSAPTAPGV